MLKVLKSHSVFFQCIQITRINLGTRCRNLSRSLRVMYADCTGESLKKVNEARYKISKKYMRRKHCSKFVPSSIMLGNIKASLQVFISVARLWTLSVQSHIKTSSPMGHGPEDDMSPGGALH